MLYSLQGSMNMANGNMHSYSSSTVMSYTNDGRGQPKVYQATTSTRQAPGGVIFFIFKICFAGQPNQARLFSVFL